MKRLQITGIGSKQKQAELLTRKDVELLWVKNLLRNSMPQSLLDTIIFSMVNILLCKAGKKIANYTVRHHPTQIKVVENPGSVHILFALKINQRNQ